MTQQGKGCRSLPRIERHIDRRPDAAIRAARERDEAARIGGAPALDIQEFERDSEGTIIVKKARITGLSLR